MGLKFSGLVLDPFLYNGFNLAMSQSLGKSPEEVEILHIFAIILPEYLHFFVSLKNLLEILSTPAAFEMSIHWKTFSIVKVRLKLCFSYIFFVVLMNKIHINIARRI